MRTADTVAQVEGEIRQRLAAGEYAPGERLPEARLARSLGVSRTPVREAVRRLVSAGILEQEPNQAPRVANPTADELELIYDLRAHLESYICERAVATATAEQIARLDAAAEAFRDLAARTEAGEFATMGDLLDTMMPIEQTFHTALSDAANHPWLARMVEQADLLGALFGRLARTRDLAQMPARLERSHQRHCFIVDCIRRGDAQAAQDFIATMMRETRDREAGILRGTTPD